MRRMLVGCCCLLFALCACAGEFKKEYRMQVTVGPQFYWGMGATKFAELVKEKTGGRINVKPYFGGQLVKGAQLTSSQMVSMGAIDCAFESTINTAPVIPEMNVFSLPFFINTFENVDKLENGKTGRMIFDAMKAKGLMPLAWGENGFRQITNDKRPVLAPGDLKGLKIRVVGSPIFTDIYRQLGADPINMNWGDAVTGFQQGTVDGQENPLGVLLAVQIFQYHKYVTMWNYLIDPLVLYWNKKEWDAFPPDIKEAIQAAAIEAGVYEKALVRAGLDGEISLKILKDRFNYVPEITHPIAYLKDKGMTVTELSNAQVEAFKTATRPVFNKWAAEMKHVCEAARSDMDK